MGSSKRQPVVEAKLRCFICQNEQMILRKASRRQKPGHVKDMWCPRCLKVRKHEEQRVEP